MNALESRILNRLKVCGGKATRVELEISGTFFPEWRRAIQAILDSGFAERCQEQRFNQEMGGVYMWIGYRITKAGAEQ